MITVKSHASSFNSHAPINSTVAATSVLSVSSDKDETLATASTRSEVTNSTVSLLARQLSEAAIRAGSRLSSKNEDSFHAITGDNYIVNKAHYGAVPPNTDNPELLARARQANGFVDGTDGNPFKGLARDQLNLIAGDDSGSFTLNERRSAWEELQATAPTLANHSEPSPANGRDLMITRLYRGVEPPVALPPATRENGTQNHADFLNREDRALISDMYAYAAAQGADLRFVDHLAFEIGTYRHYSDGRQLAGSNVRYDGEGYQVTFDFKPEDAAIASSVLNGTAIKSTRFDQGFLQYILHPAQGAFSNIGGVPFLEKMVKKFSSEGADQPPLGSEFSTLKKIKIEDHIVQTTNKNIRLPPFKPVVEKLNGVWTVTEHGKAEGYTMDKITGRLLKPVVTLDDQSFLQRSNLGEMATNSHKIYFPDAVTGDGDVSVVRRIWPGNLFMLMKNYRQ